MVITSRNNSQGLIYRRSSHLRYALIYVVITFIVLLLLNVNTSLLSHKMFYNSKETTLTEKCQLLASEISSLDVINTNSVSQAASNMERLNLTEIIITDRQGVCIYDSDATDQFLGNQMPHPEISTSLQGNDVFNWSYHDGIMCSEAAVPIYTYGTLVGCVYMIEYDAQQGALIQSLQNNVLITTVCLELVVIAFSIAFSRLFTNRLRKIMTSIRIVREGDYSHTVQLSGKDELNVLSDEFNGLISRLQVSEQKRRQFVSDASHELKTPLASIKLLSDSVLQNDMDAGTVREFMQDIGNEADRLNRMTEKLLNLSKIEGQSESEFEITYTLTDPVDGTDVKATIINSAMITEADTSHPGVVKIAVSANTSNAVREGAVVVSYGALSFTVVVEQDYSTSGENPIERVTIEANQLVGNYYGDNLAAIAGAKVRNGEFGYFIVDVKESAEPFSCDCIINAHLN